MRARLKPIEEIPDWVLCCGRRRAAIEAESRAVIVEVDPRWFLVRTKCPYCGLIVPDVRAMQIRESLGAGAMIAVDCYEFDEGAA